MTQITSADDNYLLPHPFITIRVAEHHIDHNQETDITTDQTVEITTTTKDLEIITEVTKIEVQALIEIFTTETTAKIETTIIIDKIIADQILHIQTEIIRDKTHHTIKIIIIITITTRLTDKDNTAKTQTELTDIDKDQIVTTETTQKMRETIEEIHRIGNKMTITIQEIKVKIEIIITIIKRVE